MLYFIKRAVVWLRRMRYSKGFGVQSPWAYKFVREVINDHTSYDVYKVLERQVFGLDRRTRKLCRFYYRLAKFVRPDLVLDYYPTGTHYKAYFLAGQRCEDKIVNETSPEQEVKRLITGHEERVLVRTSFRGDYETFIDDCLNRLPSQSVIIVQHIKRDSETKAFWNKLVADERVGVSFDLYYCGCLFLNTKMYKQNYIINF